MKTVYPPTNTVCGGYKNKGRDQLCRNSAADQHLCFSYMVQSLCLLPKPLVIFSGCTAWSETLKTGFLMMQHSFTRITALDSSTQDKLQWMGPNLKHIKSPKKKVTLRHSTFRSIYHKPLDHIHVYESAVSI